MEAGYELDVKVAEKILGLEVAWRWCKKDYYVEDGWYSVEDLYVADDDDDDDDPLWPPEELEAGIKEGKIDKLPCARIYRDDGSFFYHETLPKYSINIADAENVIKRLNERGYDVGVRWLQERGAMAEVTNAKGYSLGRFEATVPLAVCLLALDITKTKDLTNPE